MFVILTGIVGAVIAPTVNKLAKIKKSGFQKDGYRHGGTRRGHELPLSWAKWKGPCPALLSDFTPLSRRCHAHLNFITRLIKAKSVAKTSFFVSFSRQTFAQID